MTKTAPSPEINLALVGLGRFTEIAYIPALTRSRYASAVNVVAVCDLSAERVDMGRKAFSGAKGHTDFTELLDEHADRLDAVAIATPDHSHTPLVLAALEAGLHVLVEKPITTSADEARLIAAKAREKNLLVRTDFHKRLDPAHQQARHLMTEGAYGQLQSGSVWFMDTIDIPLGEFFVSDLVAHSSAAWFLGTHCFDLMHFVTGLTALRVEATGFRHAFRKRGVQGYDCIDVRAEYDSGAVIQYLTGWHLPETMPAISTQGYRLQCSAGLLTVDTSDRGMVACDERKYRHINPMFIRDTPSGPAGCGIESIGEALLEFARCKHGGSNETGPVDGFEATAIAEAVHRSLDRGTDLADGNVRRGEWENVEQW